MIRQKIDSKSPNFIGCWKIDNEKLFLRIQKTNNNVDQKIKKYGRLK